jgi:3-deoxy-D-manno-octulosonic-acid transferase
MRALAPFAPLIVLWRLIAGKEERGRLTERFGFYTQERPPGRLIWLHGASVGELKVLQVLHRELRTLAADASFLFTTNTRTSAADFARRPPASARHAYAPIDTDGAVGRFLDHWRPDLALFVESELWPNRILTTHARGVRLGLFNATMSARSRVSWSKRANAARAILSALDVIVAAETDTAHTLSTLSDRAVSAPGNLKCAADPLACDGAALAALRAEIGARPVWLAASTHEGEEDILLAAHAAIRGRHRDALLIIVPRHPERGGAVAPSAPHRSSGATIGGAPVYVADTLGELGLFYRLAPVSFVGASLFDTYEGHNPVEPAQLDCAILSGPHVASFADVYALLGDSVESVQSADEIAAAVQRLWADAGERARRCTLAKDAVAKGAAALAQTRAALQALLARGAAHARA